MTWHYLSTAISKTSSKYVLFVRQPLRSPPQMLLQVRTFLEPLCSGEAMLFLIWRYALSNLLFNWSWTFRAYIDLRVEVLTHCRSLLLHSALSQKLSRSFISTTGAK